MSVNAPLVMDSASATLIASLGKILDAAGYAIILEQTFGFVGIYIWQGVSVCGWRVAITNGGSVDRSVLTP